MSGEARALTALLREIRACRYCAAHLPHEPRPVLRAAATARLMIVGQAPGTQVHLTGIPWNDRSGDRLREWLALDRATFYDERRIAIVPAGFCFPGLSADGADLPPRRECAPLWHPRLRPLLPRIELTILAGSYAQAWYLKNRRRGGVGETVAAWRDYLPDYLPLPHPSWRNTAWLRRNPWFESELVPELRARVARVIGEAPAGGAGARFA